MMRMAVNKRKRYIEEEGLKIKGLENKGKFYTLKGTTYQQMNMIVMKMKEKYYSWRQKKDVKMKTLKMT